MSCGVGCRHSSDPDLLWLWCRPAAAVLFQPLAWELLYAASAALKSENKNKNRSYRKREWENKKGEMNVYPSHLGIFCRYKKLKSKRMFNRRQTNVTLHVYY